MFTWRRLFRRRPQRPYRQGYFRPVLEALEDRYAPAIGSTIWQGAAGGLWSVAGNWKSGVPNATTVAVFDGTTNTNSTMDLGGGTSYDVAGLTINANYTQTITLTGGTLWVDVLKMYGGIVAGTKGLVITQDARDATNFGTSYFAGGKLTTTGSFITEGDSDHQVTLVLAGGTATPDLETDLVTDEYTTMQWSSGNMTVGGGNTIFLNGTFTVDSTGTMGNNTATWTIQVQTGAKFFQGEGKLPKGVVKPAGGKIIKQASAIPGSNNVFVVSAMIDDGTSGGSIEVQSGTVSVQGNFTQSDITTTVDAGQTLSVTGTTTIMGGTVADSGSGATLSVASLQQSGGTLTVDGGQLNASGSITLSGGTLTMLDAATLTASSGIVIEGAGTLSGSGSITGNVENGGTINVGGAGAVGTLSITGNFTQGGTVNVELASSTSYDQLQVSGLASLAGTLNVSFLSGYMPSPGDSFSVLTYGSRTGAFGTVNLPSLSSGSWDPDYDDPSGTFTLWVNS